MIRSSFSSLSAASLCWLMASGSLFAQKHGGNVSEPTKANVSYGPHERHVMDVWLAAGEGPRPVVVHYHSGGWSEGSKERISRDINPKQLLDAGISVVAVNYRLIPGKATSPATIDTKTPPPVDAPLSDARRALQFVRLHAKEWNMDAQKVGVAGGSAGGCTSLWLAFFSQAPALGQGGGDATHSSNFGAGLKALCDQAKVPCELFYKGMESAEHTSTTDYLIKQLTK